MLQNFFTNVEEDLYLLQIDGKKVKFPPCATESLLSSSLFSVLSTKKIIPV